MNQPTTKTELNVFARAKGKEPRYFLQMTEEKQGVKTEIMRGVANDRAIAKMAGKIRDTNLVFRVEEAPE